MPDTNWSGTAYRISNENRGARTIFFIGRDRCPVEALMVAGENGCTHIYSPGSRWSRYVSKPRKPGFEVETVQEAHGSPFPELRTRYMLRSTLTRAESSGEAA